MKRMLELDRRAVVRLAHHPARIGEPYEFRHPAQLRHLRAARRDLDSDRAKPLGDFREPRRIRHLPSGVRDVVGVIATQRGAIGMLVHPPQQAPILGAPPALQSKDSSGEILPRLDVPYPKSEIPKAPDRA